MDALGRYRLVEELSQGYLGPRWLARTGDAEEDGPPIVIRRIALDGERESTERLSAAAIWAKGVTLAGGPAVRELVTTGAEIGVVAPFHAGETLRMLLARDVRREIRAEVGVALRVTADLLEELARVQAAASHGLDVSYAHGGVAPDSVLVGTDGRTHLLDVGVGAVASALSRWSGRVERLAYDVPERCGTYASIDASADVFAVGLLLWELIAGRRLFDGKTREELTEQLLNQPIPRLDEVVPDGSVSPGVASLVACALERDPEHRFADAAALRDAIERLDVPLGSRDDVADFVKGGADRLSRAVGRLSERPSAAMGLPPPPVGVLLIPDWVKAAMDGDAHEAVTRADDVAPERTVELAAGQGEDALPAPQGRAEPRAVQADPPASPATTRTEVKRDPSRPGSVVRVALAVVVLVAIGILAMVLARPEPDEARDTRAATPEANVAGTMRSAPEVASATTGTVAPPVSTVRAPEPVAQPVPIAPPAPVLRPEPPTAPSQAAHVATPATSAASAQPPPPAPPPRSAPSTIVDRAQPTRANAAPEALRESQPAATQPAKARAKRVTRAKTPFVPDGI